MKTNNEILKETNELLKKRLEADNERIAEIHLKNKELCDNVDQDIKRTLSE